MFMEMVEKMENVMEMMTAVKDYNLEICKGMNTLTRDMAKLHFEAVEQVVFQKRSETAKKDACDYAEKGLTCAMPL